MDGTVSGGRKAGPRGWRVPGAQGGAGRAVLGESGVQGAMCSLPGQDIDGLLIQGREKGDCKKNSAEGWLGGVG